MVTDTERKEIKRIADSIVTHIIWDERIDKFDEEHMSLLFLEIISQLSEGWLEI